MRARKSRDDERGKGAWVSADATEAAPGAHQRRRGAAGVESRAELTKLADTISALRPELIECLDTEGRVIRAQRTDADDAQRSAAADIPIGLSQDPSALMLTHFANLLHRAYEHSTEIAFTRLVELTQAMGERSDAIEQRLERTEAANRRLLPGPGDIALERAQELADAKPEAGSGFVEQMGAAFLSGQMQSAGVPTNGKGAPKS